MAGPLTRAVRALSQLLSHLSSPQDTVFQLKSVGHTDLFTQFYVVNTETLDLGPELCEQEPLTALSELSQWQ